MSTDRLPWHAGAVQSQQPSQRRLCRLVMHINNVQRAYRRCRKNRTNNCTLWVKKRYDYTLARDFAKRSDTDRSSNSFNAGVSSINLGQTHRSRSNHTSWTSRYNILLNISHFLTSSGQPRPFSRHAIITRIHVLHAVVRTYCVPQALGSCCD